MAFNHAHFNLPANFYCKLGELYRGGSFINQETLTELVRRRTGNQGFVVTETTHLLLKNCLKYVVGQRDSYNSIRRVFPSTIPLYNPNPPKFTADTTITLFNKIKKGSSMYRKVLDRNLDFVTASRVDSWKKTTGEDNISPETIRKSFKAANDRDMLPSDNDSMVRFLLRKTIFNYQNHRIFPDQATRPEWAQRINCWSCETYLSRFNIETVNHAMYSCPCLSIVRKTVLLNFGIMTDWPHQTTPARTFLWGDHFRSQTGNKPCNTLGNFINNLISNEFLRNRGKKLANMNNIYSDIKKKLEGIVTAKPRSILASELHTKLLLNFNQNCRPPEA